MRKVRGLYKRGEIWWIRYAGFDGKKRLESSKSKNLKLAEKLLVQRKSEVMEGKDIVKNNTNYTFNELATEYHKWAERQKSYRKSKIYLITQLTQTFSNLPIKRFNSMLLEQYQTEKLKQGKKPSTVNRLLSTISHMFTKAEEWDMVDEGVIKKIRKVKLLPENNKRLRYLAKDECKALIQACSPHLQPIVITALNTGMRKAEILGLRWNQVDLNHGFILLDKTKNGERREIPINQSLKDTLQSLTIKIDSPYVFNDSNGNRFNDVRKSFKTACKKADIHDFTFHDCRHTAASHLIMAGVDLTTVKEILGHKNISQTIRYSHLAPSHKIKAVEMLDMALNGMQSIQKVYNFEK